MADSPSMLQSKELNGAAKIIGINCMKQNRDFILCKKSNGDPAKCLPEGRTVTSCVMETVNILRTACTANFEAYSDCLVENAHEFDRCRNEQNKLRMCFSDYMAKQRSQ